ncbi:hypothetical protein CO678_42360 [Bradyrhizobium diazoefficiens]|uniref:hypothetical protein n=1 Tax=Bradyrhizobium diazoefficiens TaxID=1355477 RepID=UPI000BE82644|nr:hypothetical protein [Bradyrhizobium diazoefficiens]PDT55706.1 hypothetical protein CO678_42360 [Bradyrhizobium diazoefficiens]
MAAWPTISEMQCLQNNATNVKTQEIKSALVAILLGTDAIGATRNLINMVAVSVVSGTVLLGLLAAKHF